LYYLSMNSSIPAAKVLHVAIIVGVDLFALLP